MKKMFIAAIVSIVCMTATAQEKGQFRFGVTGGMNLSTANLELSHSSKIGFHAGLIGEYNFTENIFLDATLKYSMRGVKDVSAGGYKLEWNPSYIELPIHVDYRYDFSDAIKAFIGVGPYFAYGITGKIKANDGSDADLYSDDASRVLGGKYNRFEMGIGGKVGIEFSSLQLRVGYDWGLTKIADMNNSAKNSNLYVGIAYIF